MQLITWASEAPTRRYILGNSLHIRRTGPMIICGMADGPRPFTSKNEQPQPRISSEPAPPRHAPLPMAAPEHAPTPRKLTGLLIAIGIAIIVLAVWFFMRIGTFAPQTG
jgi:hypothetical protein